MINVEASLRATFLVAGTRVALTSRSHAELSTPNQLTMISEYNEFMVCIFSSIAEDENGHLSVPNQEAFRGNTRYTEARAIQTELPTAGQTLHNIVAIARVACMHISEYNWACSKQR
jgi:hypothetical protein